MAWIESHQTLSRHNKTLDVTEVLAINRHEVIGLLMELWWWALDNVPSNGFMGRVSDTKIATAAQWSGDASEFVNALIAAGFIEEREDGRWLHDWYDYAGKLLVRREKDAERKRSSDGIPTDIQRSSNGVPYATVPNSTKERDKRDPPSANASGVHIELGVTGGAQSSETGNGRKTAAEKPNEYTDEFEEFWAAYPRRKEKQKAFKVWRTRLKEGVTPTELIAAAERYTMDCRKHQTEEKFIKFPATFLGPDRHYQDYEKSPDDRPKVVKDDPNYEEIQANRRMLGLGGT